MSRGADWAFIIVAAGSGSRLGREPKQFRMLGGRPLWEWSALAAASCVDEVVAVFPQGQVARRPEGLAGRYSATEGGRSRNESVLSGLNATEAPYVMVHDAARPFLNESMLIALMNAVTDSRGAAPLLTSADSLKELRGGKLLPIARETILRTQTPQAFPRRQLLEVLNNADSPTDESSAWIESGREFVGTAGDERNFKITTELDWKIAQFLTEGEKERRSGFGFDVHELVPERRLILGGLEIPSPLGLLGHSDADLICHAISDALLGAAGLGDIGTLFPASDDRYRDADSLALLERVLIHLAENGWRAVWIDVTLVAQVPRLGVLLPDIVENISKRLENFNLGDKLHVKVKSGEGVGSVGRGCSMTAYAVATLEKLTREERR